ncbi:hypothetical protein Pcinc_023434 [Petrolisthes cinctipes]|uniref:Uncharacterized protein n=1 Tax=Petrolisthes cinctipes TaxID=88211 RepID=A0AAE1KEI8_PETCI|nr:hypothetical protein Pcinc_023434 [Petrolisthes cinctipes]
MENLMHLARLNHLKVYLFWFDLAAVAQLTFLPGVFEEVNNAETKECAALFTRFLYNTINLCHTRFKALGEERGS